MPDALAVKALSVEKSIPNSSPITAFTCKVLVAPCEEKRNSAGNLRALGVAGNCYLSITEKQRAKGDWIEQDVVE